jgi:EAL domain-containing protein (putative c-di-GMP-specific phosphodiesterase class I)
MAHDSGQGVQLELAAAHQAIDSLIRLPYGAFLCLNASVDTAAALAKELGVGVASRLVIDIPYTIGCHDRRIPALESLRTIGAEISIDDVPIHDLENVCQQMGGLRPSFIKVDALAGISGSSTRITQLAHGAAWCHEAGINLVAERVQSARDLVTLTEVGVEWAQGYSLARPAEL